MTYQIAKGSDCDIYCEFQGQGNSLVLIMGLRRNKDLIHRRGAEIAERDVF